MSVIFGIKEEAKLIIGADNRVSDINNNVISDNELKIKVINDKLCFATAGNNAIGQAIVMRIDNYSPENMNVNTTIKLVNDFYNEMIEKQCDTLLFLPFYCIIAGENNQGEACIISGANENQKFHYMDVPMVLFNPADVDNSTCSMIFAKNYKLNHSMFVEQTIKDISEISKVVSPTGNKWVFDIKTKTGKLYSF